MKTLKRLLDDIHRIANWLSYNPSHDVTITLSADTENLLREIRWHRVRKETV